MRGEGGNPLIILGIDPGSRITGYGLVSKNGNKISHVDNGLINVTAIETFPKRLLTLFEKISLLITKFKPDVFAIESIFHSKNAQSALKLGHARGVALVAASQNGLECFEYTPLEVKKSVVGFGGASKDQVQKMVKTLLNLPQVAEENASDALAVALCHSQSIQLNHGMNQQLDAQKVLSKKSAKSWRSFKI